MNRAPCADWPRILNPALGAMPLAAERRDAERVLFVSLQDSHEPMAPMTRALERACGPVACVDWRSGDTDVVQGRVLSAAHETRPTLVFLRLQRAGTPLTPKFVEQLRAHCDRGVVIVHWNGDQYEMAGTPQAAWMVELGRVVDATLLVNMAEQAQLAQAGVHHPGFLAAGYDPECYHPIPDAPARREVVCLANAHKSVNGYSRRNWMLNQFTLSHEQCTLYGKGWDKRQVRARPFVGRNDEAAIYSGASAALSISMHDHLERYTSDRLWRMLGCGAVPLVERFPGLEGFRLQDGVNCLLWSGWDGLRTQLAWALSGQSALHGPAMRTAALELAQLHTWEARVLELLAIVDAVRAART